MAVDDIEDFVKINEAQSRQKHDADIVMRGIYHTIMIREIHLIQHQINMRKMKMRQMTGYLVEDIITDVII